MKTTKFKPSEVGPIPEEWEVKPICDIAPLQRGFDLPSSKLRDGNVPVVYSNGIGAYHDTGMCVAPALVTGRSGTVGKFTYIREGAYWPHNTALWVTSFCGNSPLYVKYLFETLDFEAFSTGTGVPTLNRNSVHDHKVAIPPRAEQERIAEALSDVDALLAAMMKLIEKKRAIKQGAMQQLLTGKKRLAGFTGKWVEKRLGDVGEFVGGGTPSTAISSYWGGDIDWYTPAEIGYAKYVNSSNRRITNEGLRNSAARVLPAGAILLTTRASIGLRAILKHEAATNQGFQSLIVNEESDSEFMYYFLSTVAEEMESRASGSTFLEISSSKLKEIPIVVPQTVAEQKAIASVLSDMDAEIAALEAMRAKYESIKQGMMQELLTGKTRLVETGLAGFTGLWK